MLVTDDDVERHNPMARTIFTPAELEYLSSQRLGRIATVNAQGNPRVVPTGFAVNENRGTIELGGRDVARTRRAEDIRQNPEVALVIDDIDDPVHWHVRGVSIRGVAALHPAGEQNSLPAPMSQRAWMEITPSSIRSWGLAEEAGENGVPS